MMSDVLCAVAVGEGILLLMVDFIAFVYRRIAEGIGLCWALFGVLLILLGTVPGLSGWSRVVPKEAACAVIVSGFVFLLGIFYLSATVSQLLRKNQELAMQVSLLNQENEEILSAIAKLRAGEE